FPMPVPSQMMQVFPVFNFPLPQQGGQGIVVPSSRAGPEVFGKLPLDGAVVLPIVSCDPGSGQITLVMAFSCAGDGSVGAAASMAFHPSMIRSSPERAWLRGI